MKDINCELINTDVLTTDYKTITHPNGFIFKYQLQQLNQEEQQFVLSSIKYLKSEDNYLFFIDPNNLDVLSHLPFNDNREVSKLVTPVKDLFKSEQDIIDSISDKREKMIAQDYIERQKNLSVPEVRKKVAESLGTTLTAVTVNVVPEIDPVNTGV